MAIARRATPGAGLCARPTGTPGTTPLLHHIRYAPTSQPIALPISLDFYRGARPASLQVVRLHLYPLAFRMIRPNSLPSPILLQRCADQPHSKMVRLHFSPLAFHFQEVRRPASLKMVWPQFSPSCSQMKLWMHSISTVLHKVQFSTSIACIYKQYHPAYDVRDTRL